MGYTTKFKGQFTLDRPLTVAHLRTLESIDGSDTEIGGYCQWVPTTDGTGIEWDNGEKFYDYVPWLKHIVEKFLVPWGYILNGAVQWSGESVTDIGTIVVKNNAVSVAEGFADEDMVVAKVPRLLVEAYANGELHGEQIADIVRAAAGL